jgi:hypothetical protein
MASVRPVKRGFSPLDEELAILPEQLTPLLQDHLAHLGSWMPFAKAATMLERFTQVGVAKATAQRHTEAIGLAYEAIQCAEVERIERDWPEVEAGPGKLLLSADGAMVPLVGGDWAEVKTLVVGEVAAPIEQKGERVVPTHTLSYFSRMTDADSFGRLTLGELYRRRVERAAQVATVSDGAEWIQGFIDFHCPEARRILDFPHAAQRICQIGEAVLGSEHASLRAWQTRKLHHLKHHGPEGMLDRLRTFAAAQEDLPVVAENLAYLEKRVGQMQYPTFQAEGWPIGSGVVESANKVVGEARLKGAGMHWARASVNPLWRYGMRRVMTVGRRPGSKVPPTFGGWGSSGGQESRRPRPKPRRRQRCARLLQQQPMQHNRSGLTPEAVRRASVASEEPRDQSADDAGS